MRKRVAWIFLLMLFVASFAVVSPLLKGSELSHAKEGSLLKSIGNPDHKVSEKVSALTFSDRVKRNIGEREKPSDNYGTNTLSGEPSFSLYDIRGGRRVSRSWNGFVYYPTLPIDIIYGSDPGVDAQWSRALGLMEKSDYEAVSVPEIIPQPLHTKGTIRVPAIMIEFQDVKFRSDHNTTYYDDLLNSETDPSLRLYYLENSYGALTIIVDVYGIVVSNYTLSYYGEDGNYTDDANVEVYELAREAVIKADPLIDYSMYDNNGDGFVDIVIIIHAGTGQEWSHNSTDIWSHRWSIQKDPPQLDGVYIMDYTMQPEHYPPKEGYPRGASLLGVFCHEFGHALGLPDLYDVDYSSSGIGNWGLMGSGSWTGVERPGDNPAHLCAWSKAFLGYIDPVPLNPTLTGLNVLQPVETSGQVIKIPIPGHVGEYFLIEYRSTSSGALFDRAIPGSGLLIWHIDENVAYMNWDDDSYNNWEDNDVNANESHYMVDLEEFDNYDGTQELELGINRGEASDAWKNVKIGFWDYTNPSSRAYDSSPSRFGIYAISTATETISFRIMADIIEVRDPVTIENKTIYINSNISIVTNGVLALNNAVALINASHDNEFNIFVNGGELILNNTIVKPVSTDISYSIEVYSTSTIEWINTSILYTEYPGEIYIGTDYSIRIVNVTIAHGSYLRISYSQNATVAGLFINDLSIITIYSVINSTFSAMDIEKVYNLAIYCCNNITISESYLNARIDVHYSTSVSLQNITINRSLCLSAASGWYHPIGYCEFDPGALYLEESTNVTLTNVSLIGRGLTVLGPPETFTTLKIENSTVNNKSILLYVNESVNVMEGTYGEIILGYVDVAEIRDVQVDFIEVWLSNSVVIENVQMDAYASFINVLGSKNITISNVTMSKMCHQFFASGSKDLTVKNSSFSRVSLVNVTGVLKNNIIEDEVSIERIYEGDILLINNKLYVSHLWHSYASHDIKYYNNTFLGYGWLDINSYSATTIFMANDFSQKYVQLLVADNSKVVFRANVMRSANLGFEALLEGDVLLEYNYYIDLDSYEDLDDDLIVDKSVVINQSLGIIDEKPLVSKPTYVGRDIVCLHRYKVNADYVTSFNVKTIGSNVTGVKIRYEWDGVIYLDEALYDVISDTYRLAIKLGSWGTLKYWIIVKSQENEFYTSSYVLEIPDKNPPRVNVMYHPVELVEGEDLTVYANVSDESELAAVLLNYTYGDGWVLVNMSYNPDTGYYEARIEGLRAGTLLLKVYAEDTYGNNATSETIFVDVKRRDESPPSITVLYSPEHPMVNGNLTIYAFVSDESSLASVVLVYYNGTVWESVDMVWNATMGCWGYKFSNLKSSEIFFKVVAVDVYGNRAESEVFHIKLQYPPPPTKGVDYTMYLVPISIVAILTVLVYIFITRRRGP
ncbi:MAG: M6 family metalloprotease domain-containing protein [Candidatus Njordarchaeales archaeon]